VVIRRAHLCGTVVISHRTVSAGLHAEVMEIGGSRPAFLGESATAHVGLARSGVEAPRLTPEPNMISMISESREHTLVAHEKTSRVVALHHNTIGPSGASRPR
jgi:hypothetical protein